MATVLSTSMKANPIVCFLLLLLLRLKQLDMALQFTQGRVKESPLLSLFSFCWPQMKFIVLE